MDIISSYRCEIDTRNIAKYLKDTRHYFQKTVDYLVPLINESWDDIILIPVVGNKQKNYVEHLFHQTKDNPNPKYPDFDVLFPMMPSYFRRAALEKAHGIVSSYRSNLSNWEKDKNGNPPSLGKEFHASPVFYKGNTYNKTSGYNYIELKLLVNGVWKFVSINLKKSDLNYINKYWTGKKEQCPSLIKKNKKYYLVFSFKETKN